MARGQTLPQELRRRGDIDQQAIATDSLRDRPREEENVGRDGQPMISLGSVLQRLGWRDRVADRERGRRAAPDELYR